jgi:hypothetical protein
MTENERNILRNERMNQIRIALSQRAGIAKAIVKEFGEQGFNTIQREVRRDIRQWVESVVSDHESRGIKNDIEGLHMFLWEQNRDENIDFTYQDDKKSGIRTYTVTRCPIAEYACENGIQDWGRFFFCDQYKLIAKTYNPSIKFICHKRMMDGKGCCSFSYREAQSMEDGQTSNHVL